MDTRLVNSGSGTNLYFNYSVAIDPYKQLGTSIVITSTTTINTPALGTQFIASFITDSGYPGTTTIPSGIWEINQFGRVVGGTAGVLRYFFKLFKMNLAGTVTLLGISGYSADINTSVTDIFFAQLSIGTITLLATDRLLIEIHSLGTEMGGGPTLDSDYQNVAYSYITTPLVSGSNFLSLNNVFTGSNSFTNTITIPITSFPVTTGAVNGTYLTTNYVDRSTAQTIGGAKTFNGSVNVPTAVFPNATSIAVNGTYLTNNYVNNSATQTIAGRKTFSDTRTDFNLLSINGNQINNNDPTLEINLAQTSTTGNLNLGNQQTSGTIQIGNNAFRLISSAISIGSGLLSLSPIKIGNNTGATTIEIGNAEKTVTILGSASSAITTGTITAPSAVLQTIGLNYVAVPTFTSTQIGYQVKSLLGTTLAMNPSTIDQIPLQVSLGIGVWLVDYAIRFTNAGGTTLNTYSRVSLSMQGTLPVADPRYYAAQGDPIARSITSATQYHVSGSAVIRVAVAQLIALYQTTIYTATGTPQMIGNPTNAVTYLIATRIA